MRSLDELEALLGPGSEAVADLRRLWSLADGYGFADWLVFDASVVRGLAYYTGTVFEGFDRAGKLRAICGGGRCVAAPLLLLLLIASVMAATAQREAMCGMLAVSGWGFARYQDCQVMPSSAKKLQAVPR